MQWMYIRILGLWDHPLCSLLQQRNSWQLSRETSLWTSCPWRRRGRRRRQPTRPPPPAAAGRRRWGRRRCSWCSRPPWKPLRWGQSQSWAVCGGRWWWGEWWRTGWHWWWRAPARCLSTWGRHPTPDKEEESADIIRGGKVTWYIGLTFHMDPSALGTSSNSEYFIQV